MLWRCLALAAALAAIGCGRNSASAQKQNPEPIATQDEIRLTEADVKILFIGNSHTAFNDVPYIVRELIESDGSGRKVGTQLISVGHLKDAWNNKISRDKISNGGWDYVVLQGQEISSSHKYDYSKEEAINLAALAKQHGATPLLYSEWKRQNVEETEYIENIYRYIGEQSGAEVIPVGRVWDRALSERPQSKLWAHDGNHASPMGGFLAAATIALWINGPDTPIKAGRLPEQVKREDKEWLLKTAKSAVTSFKADKKSDDEGE